MPFHSIPHHLISSLEWTENSSTTCSERLVCPNWKCQPINNKLTWKLTKPKNRTNIFSARAFGACFVLGLKSEPGLSDRPTQIGLSSTDPKIWEPGITSIYNIIFALFDVGVVDLLASPLVLPCPVQSKPNQSNSFRSFVRLSFAFNLLFGLNKQQLRGKLF